jgi:AcrR family transcriptional regulator
MPRPPAAESLLNPERIVDTALRLIDREGVDALSMRKLASELGVTPRSLYHYVPTKDALLREIYIHVLNKLELPTDRGGDWRQILRGLAREFRGLCHSHRNVMPYFLAGHEPAPRDTAILEKMFALLQAAGLPAAQVISVSQALVAFLAGYILAELNGLFSPRHHEMRLAIARGVPGEYPHMLQLPAPPEDGDENFEIALDLLIAGIEGRLS